MGQSGSRGPRRAPLGLAPGGQGHNRGAVVREVPPENLPAPFFAPGHGVLPGQANGGVHGVRPARSKIRIAKRPREPAFPQPIHQRETARRGKGRHHETFPGNRLGHGVGDFLSTVADIGHDGPARGIENRETLGRVEVGALGALDAERGRGCAGNERPAIGGGRVCLCHGCAQGYSMGGGLGRRVGEARNGRRPGAEDRRAL